MRVMAAVVPWALGVGWCGRQAAAAVCCGPLPAFWRAQPGRRWRERAAAARREVAVLATAPRRRSASGPSSPGEACIARSALVPPCSRRHPSACASALAPWTGLGPCAILRWSLLAVVCWPWAPALLRTTSAAVARTALLPTGCGGHGLRASGVARVACRAAAAAAAVARRRPPSPWPPLAVPPSWRAREDRAAIY